MTTTIGGRQYNDRTLNCVECGKDFLFSSDEQSFFHDKGFTNDPKRCHSCRKNRKARNDERQQRDAGRGYRRN